MSTVLQSDTIHGTRHTASLALPDRKPHPVAGALTLSAADLADASKTLSLAIECLVDRNQSEDVWVEIEGSRRDWTGAPGALQPATSATVRGQRTRLVIDTPDLFVARADLSFT